MADKDFMVTSIKSYKMRLKRRKQDAIEAILRDDMWNAQIALGECIGFEAAISELEFQIECMEVENA